MNDQLRAVLFDLDGTLVDTALGIAAAVNAVREDRGGQPIDTDLIRPLVSRGVDALLSHTLAEFSSTAEEDRISFRRHLQSQPADPRSIYPGAIEALERLVSSFFLGVVTNKPEVLAAQLLDELQLARYFVTIVGGDSTPSPKPHRAPIDLALMRIACKPSEVVMIGDSNVDFEASVAAGCDFLLYTGGYGPINFKAVSRHFASYSELPAMLKSMYS